MVWLKRANLLINIEDCFFAIHKERDLAQALKQLRKAGVTLTKKKGDTRYPKQKVLFGNYIPVVYVVKLLAEVGSSKAKLLALWIIRYKDAVCLTVS